MGCGISINCGIPMDIDTAGHINYYHGLNGIWTNKYTYTEVVYNDLLDFIIVDVRCIIIDYLDNPYEELISIYPRDMFIKTKTISNKYWMNISKEVIAFKDENAIMLINSEYKIVQRLTIGSGESGTNRSTIEVVCAECLVQSRKKGIDYSLIQTECGCKI